MRLSFVLGLLVVVGCSSSEDSTTPGVSADKACADLAALYCEKASGCAPLFIQLEYGDVATCTSRFKTSCMTGLAAPSTASTPNDIAACVTAAKSMTCGMLFDNNAPKECQPKSGGLDNGKACTTASQCKSAYCQLDENTAVCGVCAAKPAAGGSCKTGSCPSPLKCSPNDTCNAPAAAGGACSESIPCATGSTCYASKCVADAATEGAACHPDNGPNCDNTKGLFCLTNKCVKVKAAAAGAECGFVYDTATMSIAQATLCEKGGWCKGVDLTKMPPVLKGTCEPAAKDGDACIADTEFNKGPGCIAPAVCVGGKCTLSDNATCK